MKGEHLIGSSSSSAEGNIYANKSAIVLDWLLHTGLAREEFTIREVAREAHLSVGLVQRTFHVLVAHGIVQTSGLRTAKRFSFRHPQKLLQEWTARYNIVKKCRMWSYSSGFRDRNELLHALASFPRANEAVLALHSAAEAHGYSTTNLQTLELYMTDLTLQPLLEGALRLEPQERGYDVLLIQPYYKALLETASADNQLRTSPLLLTFLDLYHFPLRGREQAEHIAHRADEFKAMRR